MDTAHLHELIGHLQRVTVILRAELALQVDVHIHQAWKNKMIAKIDDRNFAIEICRIRAIGT